MSKFLTGENLENAIYDIIWQTEEQLLIVSPFIKLDDYFKKLFNKHENNPKIHLLIVFGKNENEVRKSLSKADFDYFKKFPNISIVYVPNLHAKYYGNERKGIITSINLYDYSFKNNIEFGVFSELSILDKLKSTADNAAWSECIDLAEKNEVVFIKRPAYQNKKLIINLGKNYVKSEVLHDSTEKFYGYYRDHHPVKYLSEFEDEILLDNLNGNRPAREENIVTGYCIRTGTKIPFNPEQPFSYDSWKVWNEYGKEDFPENFCHFSGEPTNGQTCFSKPILRKNWRKAKEVMINLDTN